MNKEKNLKPFEKGVSGNPGGRPKWKQVTELLKQELGEEKIIALLDVVYEKALGGDMRAVEFIADRLEGKVAQRVSVSTNNEPEQIFEFVDMRDSVVLQDDEKAEPLPLPTKVSER